MFRKNKRKRGSALPAVVGTILGMTILATASFAYAYSSRTTMEHVVVQKKTLNSAKSILSAAAAMLKGEMTNDPSDARVGTGAFNEEGVWVSTEGTYIGDIYTMFNVYVTDHRTDTTPPSMYLYYEYNNQYLKTSVILSDNEKEDDDEYGKGDLNDTLFSEEAKVDEIYNIGNMGTMYLSEQGLLPGRSYSIGEISLIKSDIDTVDEAFAYMPAKSTLLVDDLVFVRWDRHKKEYVKSNIVYRKDANGNNTDDIVSYDPYTVIYHTGQLGGNYYWMSYKKVDPSEENGWDQNLYATTAHQERIYTQSYDTELICNALAYEKAGDDGSIPTANMTYTYNEATDSHKMVYKLYRFSTGKTDNSATVTYDSIQLAEIISNYVYYNYCSDIENRNNQIKKTYVYEKLFTENYINNSSFISRMQNKVYNNHKTDKHAGGHLLSYTHTINGTPTYGNLVWDEYNYAINLSMTANYKYSGWFVNCNEAITNTDSFDYNALYNIFTNEMGLAPANFDSIPSKESLVDTLGYNYVADTTVREIVDGYSDSNWVWHDGYKNASFTNSIVKTFIAENEHNWGKTINGEIEYPVSYQLRDDNVRLYSEGDQVGGTYYYYQLVIILYYSDGSNQQKQIDRDNGACFKILTYNPNSGATAYTDEDSGLLNFNPVTVELDDVAPVGCIYYEGRNFEKGYGTDPVNGNYKPYTYPSTFTNKNVTTNTYIENSVVHNSGTISITNNATLFIDGNLTLNGNNNENNMTTLSMARGTTLYINGDLNVNYDVSDGGIFSTIIALLGGDVRSTFAKFGVALKCTGANIIVNGNFNYAGFKSLNTGVQSALDTSCTDTDGTHPNGECRSLISGTYVINGDLNFIAKNKNVASNPLLNATFYVDGICNLTGLWTAGLYDKCRPNFIFARSILQPDIAWGTVFPSSGGIFQIDEWCGTNGYLFMICEDAIDFSELNFAAVNIFTPYDILVNALENNANDAQWNFTEYITKEEVNYTIEQINDWGLCEILRQGMVQTFTKTGGFAIINKEDFE